MANNALFDLLNGGRMQPAEFDNRGQAQRYANALMRLANVGASGNEEYVGARLGASLPVGGGLSFDVGRTYGASPLGMMDGQQWARPEMLGKGVGLKYQRGNFSAELSRSRDREMEAAYQLMFSRQF